VTDDPEEAFIPIAQLKEWFGDDYIKVISPIFWGNGGFGNIGQVRRLVRNVARERGKL